MTSRLATPLDASVQPEFSFDASDRSTYTLDGDGKVQSRADVSGKGVVASAEAGRRPSPIPAGSTAFPLPALSYDGAIEFTPIRITGATLTAFLVVQIIGNGAAYDRVMSYGRRGFNDFNETGSFDVELSPYSTAIRLQRNGGSDHDFDITKPAVIEVICDGIQGRLFLNGNLWQSSASSGSFNIDVTTFGGSIMNAQFLRSIQAAQLVYADALSEADRALVRGALAWKWDGGSAGPLVSQLPNSDPYKLAPPRIETAGPVIPKRRRPPIILMT